MKEYLLRYNKADPVKRWVVEDPGMGLLFPVKTFELKNVYAKGHVDDLQCLHSVKIQGTLVIVGDHAMIMGDEPKT